MIFQEKAVKEMLEFNNRREGPILEGDETLWFTAIRKVEDNNLSAVSYTHLTLPTKA